MMSIELSFKSYNLKKKKLWASHSHSLYSNETLFGHIRWKIKIEESQILIISTKSRKPEVYIIAYSALK